MTEQSTYAYAEVPVSQSCEDKDCHAPAEYSFVVTGDFGKDGIAVYCSDHADERDRSDVHTAVGEVSHE